MGWFDDQDRRMGVPTPQARSNALGYGEDPNAAAPPGPPGPDPTTAQANTELLTSLDAPTLAGYTPQNSTPGWYAAVQAEQQRRAQASSGAPSGLNPIRQRIWDNFHSAQNKNPIRDPNETDYAYWEGKYGMAGADPAYFDQRMFDREGEGSNA